MRRFVLATTVGSARQMLALVTVALAIGGAIYLGSHPLSFSRWARCAAQPQQPQNLPMLITRYCRTPSRFSWQIPAAVLLGLVGLGSAVVIRGRHRPRYLSDGVYPARVASDLVQVP